MAKPRISKTKPALTEQQRLTILHEIEQLRAFAAKHPKGMNPAAIAWITKAASTELLTRMTA